MLGRALRPLPLTLLACLVLAGCTHAPGPATSAAPSPSPTAVEVEASGSERAPGPPGEAEEEVEEFQERIEAEEEADLAGTLGRTGPVARKPAPGWAGAHIVNPTRNDWEPAVATDPAAPWVYVAVTRFGAPVCADCPYSAIMLERSRDGGKTWSKAKPVCRCRGRAWQADPILEVAPATGTVFAAWLNGWNTVVARSEDHGETWSAPVSTRGDVAWNDKPAMAVGPNGRRVYVSWNGPGGGDPYVARSLDGGRTWERQRLGHSKRYYFAYNGVVAPDGTVAFAESSINYGGPDGKPVGKVLHHAIVSHDHGRTWEDTVVGAVRIGVPCRSRACPSDYYIGHSSVGVTDDGSMAMVFDGAKRARHRQSIWVATSDDLGGHWSQRRRLSTKGEQSGFPMLIGAGDAGFNTWYMQTRGGDANAWNVWFRGSTDAGATWSDPVRLSDVTSGWAYVSRRGFREPYGDYGEIAMTSAGRVFAVWGEGMSYQGPGGVWFNRQRGHA